MRTLSRRLHRLTVEGQKATDELAYVVEENVLAWRIVRLHGAQPAERLALRGGSATVGAPPVAQGRRGRGHDDAADAAAGRLRAVGGDRGGALAEQARAAARWAASSPSSPRCCMLVAPIKHLSEVAGPITRGMAALERGHPADRRPRRSRPAARTPRSAAEGRIELRDVTLQLPRATTAPALDGVSSSDAAAGRGGGAGRPFRRRARAPSSTCCRASSSRPAAPLLLDGTPLGEWDMARAAPPVRAGQPGRRAVQRQRSPPTWR